MSKRGIRIDYKVFGSTGKKVEKDKNTDIENLSHLVDNLVLNDLEGNMATEKEVLKELIVDEATTSDEITDFMDENEKEEIPHFIDDINSVISKIEKLRSTYRRQHKQLSLLMVNYEDQYAKIVVEKMEQIKEFIKGFNQLKKQIRVDENVNVQAEKMMKNEALQFKEAEIHRIMTDLQKHFVDNLKEKSNEEIKMKNENLQSYCKQLEKLGKNIEEIINTAAEVGGKIDIDIIKQRYEKLISSKNLFLEKVKEETNNRELDKHEIFDSSKLNIKLPKYKGYGSTLDIYTFKDTFEKIHLKSTPKSLLPDLLKNNFLEPPALNLLSNVTEIDEIWSRLK